MFKKFFSWRKAL